MRPLLFALQLAAVRQNSDSLLRARVDSSIHAFQTSWTSAWRASQRGEAFQASREYVRDTSERVLAVHCHWDYGMGWVRRRIITGTVHAHATCPRFLPPDETDVDDERHGIDNGLDRHERLSISVQRQHLRVFLDSAANQLPRDIALAGQRVRFALDAGDIKAAAEVAASCGYELVQCGLLQGLVLYRIGDAERADSAFVAAASLMSPERRCEWNDVSVLLERETRSKYEAMSCEQRAVFEQRLWWLSDPLWLEPGNERRAEHFARKVTVGLLVPLGDDGRQHFTPRLGGESVIESLVRYGWPTHMLWGGPLADEGHDDYLRQHGAATAKPYLVREYSRARRLHTVPLPSTLEAPFAATRDGWDLSAPQDDDDWWPREHYARDVSAIVALPVGQMVMLRRRDSTRVVWAGAVDSARRQVTLFDSRSVGDVRHVASFPVGHDTRAIIDASLAQGETLLGIELPGDSVHAAARARFGLTVDPPLSALGDGNALSQPLLFDAPEDATGSVPTARAIEHMYTSTSLRSTDRIGVYWESYGFHATDTLDLSVRITREDQPNVLVRAFHVLGVGEAGGNDVAIRWRETPTNSRAMNQLEGSVPVQMRSIVVDLSRLPRGNYLIRLAVNRPGEVPVSNQRRFTLR